MQGGKNTQILRAQYQAAQGTINSIRMEASSWTVPNSDSARKMHECFLRILHSQETSILKSGQEVLSILENSRLSQQQKMDQSVQLLQQLAGEEATQVLELRRLQAEFARENNLILAP